MKQYCKRVIKGSRFSAPVVRVDIGAHFVPLGEGEVHKKKIAGMRPYSNDWHNAGPDGIVRCTLGNVTQQINMEYESVGARRSRACTQCA